LQDLSLISHLLRVVLQALLAAVASATAVDAVVAVAATVEVAGVDNS
jgi:hypothetical protein